MTSSRRFSREPGFFQARLRWLTITHINDGWTVWFAVGGRKPLAHLPPWRRRWLHLPAIRRRLLMTRPAGPTEKEKQDD